MKKFMLLAILALPLFSAGCTIATNIPLFYGAGLTVEVINQSDYPVSVTINGSQQTFQYRDEKGRSKETRMLFANGPSGVMHLGNWSGYGQQASLAVRGWNGNEQVGADAISLGIDGSQQQAITLTIVNDVGKGVRIDYPGGAFFRW